jgi:hypothetical protein
MQNNHVSKALPEVCQYLVYILTYRFADQVQQSHAHARLVCIVDESLRVLVCPREVEGRYSSFFIIDELLTLTEHEKDRLSVLMWIF